MAIALLSGVALGMASRAVDFVGLRWLGNVAATWVLVPFLVGRRATDSRSAMWAGVITLVAAAFAYYAWRVLLDGSISIYYLSRVGSSWCAAAVVVGVIAGWAGSRSIREPMFWGVPAGVFAGELGAVLLLSQRAVQLIVEGLALCACIWQTRPQFWRGVFVSTVAGSIVGCIATAYRLVLR